MHLPGRKDKGVSSNNLESTIRGYAPVIEEGGKMFGTAWGKIELLKTEGPTLEGGPGGGGTGK